MMNKIKHIILLLAFALPVMAGPVRLEWTLPALNTGYETEPGPTRIMIILMR